MNILYLEHYAGSPNMGMEFRPYYLSKEWTEMGNHVTIIAGDYSHLRKNNPTIDFDFQENDVDGIRYVWLKTGSYNGNGAKRAMTMGRFVGKLFANAKKIAYKYKPDLVISSSTYPLETFAAQKIASLAGARYVHEVHDMWPATLYEVGGMSKRHPFVLVMQLAENSAYKHCDKCVSLLPYSKEYMISHGLSPNKFVNIQNGIVLSEWDSPKQIPIEHQVFFSENKKKFIVGYFGGHALSNALDNALDVAKEILKINNDMIFVFVGDGVEKERLISRVKKEDISNCFFLPSVSKAAIPNLLKNFDVSYMTGTPSPLYKYGLCLNKMYDSMMAGLPIVCAFDAPETLVSIYQCGIQCSPSSKEEVINSLLQLYDMTDSERKKMGARGQQAVLNNFSYKKLAQTFLNKVLED